MKLQTKVTAMITSAAAALGLCLLSSCSVTVEDPTPDTVRTETSTDYNPYSGTTTTTKKVSAY